MGRPLSTMGLEPEISVAAPCDWPGCAASADPSVSLAHSSPESSVMSAKGARVRAIGLDVHRDFCEVAIAEEGKVRSGPAPGFVESQWLRNGMGDARYEARKESYKERAALGEVITPEDVAQAAWWLGVGASKTTGEVLLVDGGLRLTRA